MRRDMTTSERAVASAVAWKRLFPEAENVGRPKKGGRNLPTFYEFAEANFKVKEWHSKQALAIANYSPELLVGQLYNQRKKAVGGDRGNQHTVAKGKSCTLPTTAEQVAAETGVSPRTVKRAGKAVRCD